VTRQGATIRTFIPSATEVRVIVHQPAGRFAWLAPAAPPNLGDAARLALDELRRTADPTAATVKWTLRRT
jgi:hypothetical protein